MLPSVLVPPSHFQQEEPCIFNLSIVVQSCFQDVGLDTIQTTLSKEGEDVLVFVLPCLDVIVYEWYLTDGLQKPFGAVTYCYILLCQRRWPPLTILILVEAMASLPTELLPAHGCHGRMI